jgi:hypothetical protein
MRMLKARVTWRIEIPKVAKNNRKLKDPMNIVIGNPSVMTIKGRSNLRKILRSLSFNKSLEEIGSVSSHKNIGFAMIELTSVIPMKKIFTNCITKKNTNNRLPLKKTM